MIGRSHGSNFVKCWTANDGVIWRRTIDEDKVHIWICWQGLDPSSTGKFNIPSDDMLSLVNPERDEAIGSIFTPTKFILLKVDLNSMSAELSLSTRIRNTFCPVMRKVTTMASV